MSDPLAKRVSAGPDVAGTVIDAGHWVRIEEAGLTGMVSLRADLAAPAVAKALEAALGAAMPAPLSVSPGERGRVVWMSPDELLILCADGAVAGIAGDLSKALARTHHMLTDVSDARVVFRLSGARVGELIAKGAPVDLRDAAFPVGHARRSHLGEIAVGFWRLEPDLWELVCFRSLSHHVLAWLRASSEEGSEVGHL